MGQSETAVQDLVDVFVLVLPPVGGDELQVGLLGAGGAGGRGQPNHSCSCGLGWLLAVHQ